jgi:glutamate formiminotransferase / 5-formyltetrahydrofolate cyclo-ligase
MKRIVQCVPNFSCGDNLALIEKIVEPLKNQKGFKLISYEPDKDYNRTVVTLLGEPLDMLEPLINFMARVTKYIDMNHQKGEHPRMGATDVVPFIPISGISMEECVDIAHKMGKMIAEKLDIPVFMYAEAAIKKKRVNLPTIRKGEFEGMDTKIQEEDWHPDYGKPMIHKTAGVTAVGARLPLIAYNIDLNTTDLTIASSIAKAIRGSSGGFKHIQAGPVFLNERNHVQVTMNILNDKQNPIYRILETVKMEAKRYHVQVTGSEIVGLVPKDTVYRALKYYFEVNHLDINSSMSCQEMVKYAKKYLLFRDFDQYKIIEANVEENAS